MDFPDQSIDLSIVIPALNEADNLEILLPELKKILSKMDVTFEIIVIDEHADARTSQVIEKYQAFLLTPNTHGYGMALVEGLKNAQGTYIISMDADFSHPPIFISDLWQARNSGDIIIASRYIRGGKAKMPLSRYLLSRVLNAFFGIGLQIQVRDMSSGYRLYVANSLVDLEVQTTDFDVLQELLIQALVNGKKIYEIPFTYAPRKHGSSHARVFKFGIAYLKTFTRLWKIRYKKIRSSRR